MEVQQAWEQEASEEAEAGPGASGDEEWNDDANTWPGLSNK